MPIVLARVDNRLVHGQILSAWVPALSAEGVLVIDDEAARNTLVRSAMEIAIPPDLGFDVVPVAQGRDAVARLPASGRTVLLFRDIAEAARAVDSGLRLPRLNLGNIHFSHGRVPVTQAVHLSTEEIGQLESLESKGVPVELKTLPGDPGVGLAEMKRRVAARPA
jgi:PTS system mannose-specific IIB component